MSASPPHRPSSHALILPSGVDRCIGLAQVVELPEAHCWENRSGCGRLRAARDVGGRGGGQDGLPARTRRMLAYHAAETPYMPDRPSGHAPSCPGSAAAGGCAAPPSNQRHLFAPAELAGAGQTVWWLLAVLGRGILPVSDRRVCASPGAGRPATHGRGASGGSSG